MDLPKCRTCGERHQLGRCGLSRNTPEASGTARKAPSGSLLGGPSRDSVRASPNPAAKATEGKTGRAGVKDPVRRSTTGAGLRVGAASAVLPTTSEIMDATAGETAPKFDREAYHRNYMREYMRKRRAAKT